MQVESRTDPAWFQVHEVMAAVIRGLVDRPDALQIDTEQSEHGVTILVSTAELGKLIGINGRTARALRTILSGLSAKHHIRCSLNLQSGAAESAAA